MNQKRIYIIEDQPIVALDFETFLKMNGYSNTKSFTSGKHAFASIQKILPDLVVLDIKLNDDNLTGLDIAEYLKKFNIPFIFVSAFSNPENYKKALKLNPVKIFKKPINHSILLNAISEVLKSSSVTGIE